CGRRGGSNRDEHLLAAGRETSSVLAQALELPIRTALHSAAMAVDVGTAGLQNNAELLVGRLHARQCGRSSATNRGRSGSGSGGSSGGRGRGCRRGRGGRGRGRTGRVDRLLTRG